MKSKIFKTILAIFVVVCTMISIVACGTNSKEPATEQSTATETTQAVQTADTKAEAVEIKFSTFWVGTNSSKPWFDKVHADFVAKYGNEVKVEVEEIPGSQEYVDKMKILLASNELPDVVMTGGYNLLDLGLKQNAFVDLTQYIDADKAWKDTISKRGLEFNSRNGKVYGVPYFGTLMGYFYNKELFKKAGIAEPAKTWDEFFADCDKLLAAGITPLSMDTADSGWLSGIILTALVGTNGDAGNKFMNSFNPTNYELPEFIEPVKKLQKCFLKYTTKDAVGGKYDNGANNFFIGKTAMIFNGPWMAGEFSDTTKAPEGFAVKVGSAVYPDSGVINEPAYGFHIASKDKKHADAAVKYVKFMTSPESQAISLTLTGSTPDSPTVTVTDEVAKAQPLVAELVKLSQGVKYGFMDYQAVWYANTMDVISAELPALAFGKETAEAFAKKLTEAANKNIK